MAEKIRVVTYAIGGRSIDLCNALKDPAFDPTNVFNYLLLLQTFYQCEQAVDTLLKDRAGLVKAVFADRQSRMGGILGPCVSYLGQNTGRQYMLFEVGADDTVLDSRNPFGLQQIREKAYLEGGFAGMLAAVFNAGIRP